MINVSKYIGKLVSFNLKSGETISGKILEADCTGKWCRVLIKSGNWKVIKGSDIEAIGVS